MKETCYLEGAGVLNDLHVEDAVNLPGLLDIGTVGANGKPKTGTGTITTRCVCKNAIFYQQTIIFYEAVIYTTYTKIWFNLNMYLGGGGGLRD